MPTLSVDLAALVSVHFFPCTFFSFASDICGGELLGLPTNMTLPEQSGKPFRRCAELAVLMNLSDFGCTTPVVPTFSSAAFSARWPAVESSYEHSRAQLTADRLDVVMQVSFSRNEMEILGSRSSVPTNERRPTLMSNSPERKSRTTRNSVSNLQPHDHLFLPENVKPHPNQTKPTNNSSQAVEEHFEDSVPEAISSGLVLIIEN